MTCENDKNLVRRTSRSFQIPAHGSTMVHKHIRKPLTYVLNIILNNKIFNLKNNMKSENDKNLVRRTLVASRDLPVAQCGYPAYQKNMKFKKYMKFGNAKNLGRRVTQSFKRYGCNTQMLYNT